MAINRLPSAAGLFLCRLVLVMAAVDLACSAMAAGRRLEVPRFDLGAFDPQQGPLIIRYRLLADADTVTFSVTDFRGKTVQRLTFGDVREGDRRLTWDGRVDGDALSEGRYRLALEAAFPDGMTAAEAMETRIVRGPPTAAALPPLPEPSQPPWRVDGGLAGFYRINRDAPDGEQQEDEAWGRLSVGYDDPQLSAHGELGLRRRSDGTTSDNGSRAHLRRRWQSAAVKGVFRNDLGTFDDPLTLFADYRTVYQKGGVRGDVQGTWLQGSALAFGSEGDVDGRDAGLAARLALGPRRRWRLGASATMHRWRLEETAESITDQVGALDLQLPLVGGIDLLAEAAASRPAESEDDTAWLAMAVYRRGAVRATAGYIDLGPHFNAGFADPLRQVSTNARGWQASADVSRSLPWGPMADLAFSGRGFVLERPSDGEALHELDLLLRCRLNQTERLLFGSLTRRDGPARSTSLRASWQHNWSPTSMSSLEANYGETNAGDYWRGRLDTGWHREDNELRLALEAIRRRQTGGGGMDDELALLLDARWGGWSVGLSTRYHRRDERNRVNLYSRVAYTRQWLHRYTLGGYLAFGRQAALETENQIEAGMAVEF